MTIVNTWCPGYMGQRILTGVKLIPSSGLQFTYADVFVIGVPPSGFPCGDPVPCESGIIMISGTEC